MPPRKKQRRKTPTYTVRVDDVLAEAEGRTPPPLPATGVVFASSEGVRVDVYWQDGEIHVINSSHNYRVGELLVRPVSHNSVHLVLTR
jgi:hypothetical protein